MNSDACTLSYYVMRDLNFTNTLKINKIFIKKVHHKIGEGIDRNKVLSINLTKLTKSIPEGQFENRVKRYFCVFV